MRFRVHVEPKNAPAYYMECSAENEEDAAEYAETWIWPESERIVGVAPIERGARLLSASAH